MKVLTGEQSPGALINHKLRELGWGRMYVTRKPEPYPDEPWGFDNEAFGCWQGGRAWDAGLYMERLAIASGVGVPLLAVMPDKPTEGLDSLHFSVAWRELAYLPKWPWYLAVQDGMTVKAVREVAHMFDGLFLGGSDKFKLTAREWARLAHDAGKKFHYGRAGTPRKVQAAFRCGADSCDSALPLWSKRKFRNFLMTLSIERNQHLLWRHEDVEATAVL